MAQEQSSDKKNNNNSSPDEQQLKTVAAVGYLGILFLLPYLMFPKNKFAVFHANQSLILLIFSVVLYFVIGIIGTATLGFGFLLTPLVWLVVFVLFIIGVVNAMNGHMKRLPLIGGFDILKVQE